MGLKTYADLSELQLDALREIGNIGSGNAATALSAMMGDKVDMSVPSVEILGYEEILNLLGGPEVLASAVLVELLADMDGIVLFMQSKEFIVALLRALLMKEIHDFEELDEMDVSAIKEIGNIIISSYVNAISQMTGLTIDITVPSHTVNMAGAILSVPIIRFAEVSDSLLLIRGNFIIDNEEFPSNLLLIPDMDSLNRMLTNLGVGSDE